MKRKKPLKSKTPLKRSPMKRTAKKKPKKTPVQRLEKEADKLMGAFIRGEGRCFAEGKTAIEWNGSVQNAHIKRRSKSKAIKFSPLNGIPLVASRHFCFDNDPTRFAVFLNKELPGRMERLEAMSEWAKNHSALFRIEDVLAEHIAWYKMMAKHGMDWREWHHSGVVDSYKDPIEELMEKLA